MLPIAIAVCAVAFICSTLVTSNGNNVILSIRFNSVSFSGLRIVAITFQPLAANSFAVALPNPVEAPVMKIVFIFLFLKLKYKGHRLLFVRCIRNEDCCIQNEFLVVACNLLGRSFHYR